MDHNIIITVIVPVYRAEQYLEQCVRSLTEQTYPNLEIILVDDGSPDNCGLLCDQYAAQDARIRVIHKENGGLSSSRAAGIAAATGDYLTFVDSDDWIDPDAFELCAACIRRDNADCVMYGYVKEYPHASIPVHLFDGDFCYDLMRSEALIHRRLIGLMPFLDLIIQEQPNISESIYLLYTINLFNTAITYFFSYRTSLLIASQRNYIVGGINYLITIIQSFLQMVYLLAFRDYLGYLLIQTAGTFLYNIIVSQIAVRYFPCIRRPNVKPLPKDEQRTLFANIRDLMIYKVSGLLVNSTDNILITFFSGLATTGIASNYTLLVNTLNSLLGQLFNGLTASIGNHNASESVEKRYEMFRFLNMMNFWLFGWASLGIFFCSGDLVELCFGAEYVLPLQIPLVMAVNFYTVGMMNAVWTYKHTLGLFRYGRFLQILTGILNITFSVLLGTWFGLFGILLATVFSRLFTSLWFDPYAVYTHGFGISPLAYLKRYVQYLLILLAAAALCHLSMSIISGSVVFRTIARIVMCSVVTNAVFVFWFHRTPEFRKLVDILLRLRNKVLRK